MGLRSFLVPQGYRLPDYQAGVRIGPGIEAGFIRGEEFVDAFLWVFDLAVQHYEERRTVTAESVTGAQAEAAARAGHYSVNRFRVLSTSRDQAGEPVLVGSNPFVAVLTAQILSRFGRGLRLAALADFPHILKADRKTGAFGLRDLYLDLGLVLVGNNPQIPFTVPDTVLPETFYRQALKQKDLHKTVTPTSAREAAIWRLSGPTGPFATALYGCAESDGRACALKQTDEYKHAVLAERLLAHDIHRKKRQKVRVPAYLSLNQLRFLFGGEASAILSQWQEFARSEGDLYFGFAGQDAPEPSSILSKTGTFRLEDIDVYTGLPRQITEVSEENLMVLAETLSKDCGCLIGAGRPGFCRLIYAGSLLGWSDVLVSVSPLTISMSTDSGRLIVVKEK